MKSKMLTQFVAIFAIALLFSSCKREPPFHCKCKDNSFKMKVFATGLNSPRGLKFGPDGNLYVAEAGIGGTDSTVEICPQIQVPFPVGPYVGSPNGGRISKINHTGQRFTISDKFPSSKDNDVVGGNFQGVGDVAFIGHTMYAVLAGGGCSHGVASVPNAVVKVNPNGSWSMVANLSDWFMAHPVQNPNPGDFEPDGTPYSMINVNGALYVMEPNHGELLKVSTNGNISRVVDISATLGHIVPTVVDHLGNFIFSHLNVFPIVDGSSSIYRIKPGGQIEVLETGFTTVLGLTHDKYGRIYVLENTTGNPFPTPGTGKVIRINLNGSREVIASGLTLPTGMTIGPDGKLYVSTVGFGPAATGGGTIIQINLNKCKCDDAADEDFKM